MRHLFSILVCLFPCASCLQAGQVVVRASGVVQGVSGASGGPYASATVGAPVLLSFELNLPGTPAMFLPSTTNYAVDAATTSFQLGAVSTILPTPLSVTITNGFPLSDLLSIPQVALPNGELLEFSLVDCSGAAIVSGDLLQNLLTLPGSNFCVADFIVSGSSTYIDIGLVDFTIDLVEVATPLCFGDGSQTACPCANVSPVGAQSGCLSSIGTGGRLRAGGFASVAQDTLLLNATGVPNGPALYFQGTTSAASGSGQTFGDGLLCVSGAIVRLGVGFATNNSSSYPGGATATPISIVGGVLPGDQRVYQAWYRDAIPGFCTSALFNLTNAVAVGWGG